MFRKHLLAAFGVIALATAPAVAQDFNLSPTFGNINLNTGFFPDPHTASIVAGGGIDANASLGGNCTGSIANAPDIRLFFSAGGLPLIISATSSSDTTLVINDPSGQWFCDDDGAGSLNPQVTFSNPQSGQYDIWVGTFGGGTANATLNISEIGGGGGGGPGPAQPAPQGPNLGLSPAFGTINLNTGFFPDPNTTSLVAGGNINANTVGGNCRGSIAEAPDIRLFFSAGSLPLIISATSSSDTTLVINAPNGQWFCDDDSGPGVNPEVTFTNAQSGQYDIWVGTFGGGTANATLSISELSSGNAGGGGGGGGGGNVGQGPDFGLSPSFGTINLNTGFFPDPNTTSLVAGGGIDASVNPGGTCNGSIAQAPDIRLFFNAGSLPLIISATSSSDTTLVINDPNGQWFCDDDSGGSLNPSVTFNNPQSGQYDIWVGTFGGGTANATLNISELSGGNAGGGGGGGGGGGNVGQGPDFGLPPAFGTINLNTGFFPDPNTTSLVAGGGIDASVNPGGNCRGSIAQAPDIRLFFNAGSLPLIISAISSSDTTLVINDPNGQWFCDDDSGGSLNPQVTFSNPQSGQYDIWVGTFGGGTANATLNISEISNTAGPGPVQPPVAQGPDFGLPPAFGTINLNTGFFPDPNTTSLVAGGGIDASVNPGGNCRGSIAQAPDIRLFFNAGGLPLIISATSSSDTTLVINDPNGQWFCDDDSGGSLNPEVTFNNPQSGQYDIWVGTFGGGTANATLNISEVSNVVVQPPGKAPVQQVPTPDFNLAPAFGTVNLNTGFQPDPHTVAITAGGFIDANAALGGNCQGSIAEAPDFRVNFSAGGLPLAFRVSSTSDTTLVINGPNGQWICDDDSGGKLNPLLRFNNPQSGQYDVWIGTFGGGTANSTLLVTETP